MQSSLLDLEINGICDGSNIFGKFYMCSIQSIKSFLSNFERLQTWTWRMW